MKAPENLEFWNLLENFPESAQIEEETSIEFVTEPVAAGAPSESTSGRSMHSGAARACLRRQRRLSSAVVCQQAGGAAGQPPQALQDLPQPRACTTAPALGPSTGRLRVIVAAPAHPGTVVAGACNSAAAFTARRRHARSVKPTARQRTLAHASKALADVTASLTELLSDQAGRTVRAVVRWLGGKAHFQGRPASASEPPPAGAAGRQ